MAKEVKKEDVKKAPLAAKPLTADRAKLEGQKAKVSKAPRFVR